ncbi:MAG TPA: hypothetical protein VF662_03015 [Allosphingosinicella sp.]|jgi:hypothetical protein
MRARKVPVSALDQLTEPELDFIAGLFVEKQKDFRHRDRAGSWWTLVRSGLLDVSSEAFNEDERAAILAATDAGAVRARQAYDALCELAGRKLDVPHSFAEFVLCRTERRTTRKPQRSAACRCSWRDSLPGTPGIRAGNRDADPFR